MWTQETSALRVKPSRLDSFSVGLPHSSRSRAELIVHSSMSRAGANHTLTVTLTNSLSKSLQRGIIDMDVDEDPEDAVEALPAGQPSSKRVGSLLVRLSSRDCPNKKTALKSLISGVIASGNSAAPDAHVSTWTAR